MEEQRNSVAFVQRGEGEYEIPGFPCYTIDDDMVVRSYYGGIQYIKAMKTKDGVVTYNLWGYNEYGLRLKHRFTALRLLLCAKAKIHPLTAKCCDFIYDRGDVRAKYDNLIFGTPERVTTVVTRTKKELNPREIQNETMRRNVEEQMIMIRAIESGDYVEVLAALERYRDSAVASVSGHGYRRKIAIAIVSEAIDIVLTRLKTECAPIASLSGALFTACRVVIKNRRARIV